MRQKFVLSVAGVLISLCAMALPASADSITLTLNLPNSQLSAIPGPYGTVTATVNGSSINVVVNMFPGFTLAGGGPAFGFNVVGSMLGLSVTNLTSGFSLRGFNLQVDEHGNFMVVLDGPPAGQSVSTLSFMVSRDGGFSSAFNIMALSSGSQLNSDFVAHVIPASGLSTGYAGAISEPASLGLLGIGMLALGLVFRRQRSRHVGSS